MEQYTDRELEIARLRVQDRLSYREIGLKFGLTASRVRAIYQRFEVKMRRARLEEFRRKENQKPVLIELKLNQVLILQRILALFIRWKEKWGTWCTIDREDILKADVEYMEAVKLENQLCECEKNAREPFGK